MKKIIRASVLIVCLLGIAALIFFVVLALAAPEAEPIQKPAPASKPAQVIYERPTFQTALTKDGKGIVITKFVGEGDDVHIPAVIDGLPVREIGTIPVGRLGQVTTHGNPTTITIPEGVQIIGRGAFAHLTNLISVTLPEGLHTIGEAAFAGCKKLASVSLPSTIQVIGMAAFENCSSLANVFIPDTVRSIIFSARSASYREPSREPSRERRTLTDNEIISRVGISHFDFTALSPESQAALKARGWEGFESYENFMRKLK